MSVISANIRGSTHPTCKRDSPNASTRSQPPLTRQPPPRRSASFRDIERPSRLDSCPDPWIVPGQAHWHQQFATIVLPLLGRLHRLAKRILRSDDLADDAVQETLISFWKEPKLPPNPSAWLVRTVIYRSLHLNRSRRRRRSHEELACLQRPEYDPGRDLIRALEAEEIGRRIDEALAALPERLREVFLLREVDQMDYESIADALSIPVGTVRSRLSRSRGALQEILRDVGSAHRGFRLAQGACAHG